MILLDSDHLTVLRYRESPRAATLSARLSNLELGPIGTTIVNVEEAMRGWLAAIAKERQVRRQQSAYRELSELFLFFGGFHIALLDEVAAQLFDTFSRIRIGAQDRKIAAIARAQQALLLTANRRDFEQIPGLVFANWLD